VLLGPQDDYFTPAAIEQFFSTAYRLAPRSDRMGYRLEGPPLDHARGFNIVSDGIEMGAIQVPGDGKPIILMADRQSTGGYPKIGYVIRADIGRLAQLRAGETLRLQPTTIDAARSELFTALRAMRESLGQTFPLGGGLSSEFLLSKKADRRVSAVASGNHPASRAFHPYNQSGGGPGIGSASTSIAG
jgi:allophanate hydrolase subunit 2